MQQQNSPAPWEGAGQRTYGGKTEERARDRRGSRDIAGEECGGASLRGMDVSIARAEAHHPRPQPNGTAGHARTRSEDVEAPEAAMDSGDPEGVSKHPSLTQRMRICGCAPGAGYLSAPDATQTRIRTVQERRQMRTRRTAQRELRQSGKNRTHRKCPQQNNIGSNANKSKLRPLILAQT